MITHTVKLSDLFERIAGEYYDGYVFEQAAAGEDCGDTLALYVVRELRDLAGKGKIVLEAAAYGLDISNMYVTEKDNIVALSYYKKAFDSLEKYSINGSKKELENYLEYYDKAQTSVYQHDNVNWLGAHIYYTKIKEY